MAAGLAYYLLIRTTQEIKKNDPYIALIRSLLGGIE